MIATPRTDENSQIAHRQLVEKARQGGIDVYFLGDSIARRWGCSDREYAELLANWRANFHGWNAGNFGWGGDRIENILWRIQNGELDGVHPKVIVILAGTNNLETGIGATELARGIEMLVVECQHRAPAATVILTAIFPRNDNMGFLPVIDETNEKLAAMADGWRVRYLNVNARLANPAGKLFEGMMPDGLHPSARGYQVWADGLKPVLTELLGPPAATDHAPPPTGDPKAAGAG